MNQNPHISIVSPVYRAEVFVEKLVFEIEKTVQSLNVTYEIVLVDDRSPDNSWQKMKQLSLQNPKVKSIRLSRNFGQHPAIMAGLSLAKGEWIVVMDCDLQDQPKEIIKLYNKANEGFDVVLAQRVNRKDSFLKRFSSYLFHQIYGYLTDTKFDNTIANFGVYNKNVIQEVLQMNDYIKSFPLFANWVGFKSIAIEVEHAEREFGTSSYSLTKLLSLAFNTIISFSNKPLKLFVKFGMTLSFFSFIFGTYTIYEYFNSQIKVIGYSSLMVSIWFLSGIIITTIGVVGIYIGKVFDQTKGRQPFIIEKIIN